MGPTLPLFPEQASTMATRVDSLYFYLLAVSAFFATLIALLVIVFAIKYRRRSESELPRGIAGSLKLEIAWTVIPLAIALSFFFWGARLFFAMNRPPNDALEVYVVGKQWMWKIQHADGQREINELHVPVNRAVRLTMTSEDVIHDFFVPAFRMKKDVLPGRYSTAWFQATRPGRYHLFCAQYCGTKHSAMIGWIDVMEPAAYEAWLSGGAASESLASAGAKLFQRHACNTCHRPDSLARGPNLEGIFGKPIRLADGRTVIADESYLRESILQPTAKIVAGFQPIMPTFQGLVNEEELLQLVAYIKSLSTPAAPGAGPAAGGPMNPPVNRAAPPAPPVKENPK
jgi:cytochrome c oxidase subunit 2